MSKREGEARSVPGTLQAALLASGISFCSSPDSAISAMMSTPPMNSPLM